MNAKLEYKLAYRHYRATKGCTGLAIDNKSVSNAWRTYRDNILLSNSCIDPIETGGNNARPKISLIYHFSTDFSLAKMHQWSKRYQLLLASQALVNAAEDWRNEIADQWLHTGFNNPGFQKINRQYHAANQYLSDVLDWQAQYQR